MQRLAREVATWPHFPPPADMGPMRVVDVALCDSVTDHIETSRKWAETVWAAWSEHHHAVAAFVARYLARE